MRPDRTNSQNRIEWLQDQLHKGNLSIQKLELAAYLGDVEARSIVARHELTEKKNLRSWIYGLNLGGKEALVRVCCPFTRNCLNYWHSFVNWDMEWFERLPKEEWFQTLSKAVEVSESWVVKPSRDGVRLAIRIQQQLDDILGKLDFLCHEGDFPDEGLYIAQVAYYAIGTTAWTVDEATADYRELGNMAEVEAIASTGPAYETVEAITIANKILKQKEEEIRNRIKDVLLSWIFNCKS